MIEKLVTSKLSQGLNLYHMVKSRNISFDVKFTVTLIFVMLFIYFKFLYNIKGHDILFI